MIPFQVRQIDRVITLVPNSERNYVIGHGESPAPYESVVQTAFDELVLRWPCFETVRRLCVTSPSRTAEAYLYGILQYHLGAELDVSAVARMARTIP